MPNKPEISQILGVDYGDAKIGLAIADLETKIATRLTTLSNNKGLFEDLIKIIRENEITTVVIGVPSYINSEDVQYPSEDFGYTLKNLLPEIEIQFANEMFSTKIAQTNLIEKGIKGIKKHDHEEAARIILQGWLDSK
ncbi:MAG TPA: Holliday junction resolvase RuvX [Patescibacteria group bacterium]|nr:Holliday junction resolvase RuvX [Patescibacteria group bacterium]